MMSDTAAALRLHLAQSPKSAVELMEALSLSETELSAVVQAMAADILPIAKGKSLHYALRNRASTVAEMAVYRVDVQGKVRYAGELQAVCAEGFVFSSPQGGEYSEGLPWWLFDLRPQGYLGRAWAKRHAAAHAFPLRLADWQDKHILQALLLDGVDRMGDILLGEENRRAFLQWQPQAIAAADKARCYPQLAAQAAAGVLAASSAAGEQPKFCAYAHTAEGARHLIVKFSEAEESIVSERWRDLLLAEHLALQTLREAGQAAAQTYIVDIGGQRFLESRRFDRFGASGRCALYSLTALDAEFVGKARASWLGIVPELARQGIVAAQAVEQTALLWAFGELIGNTDMHNGNLSFLSRGLRPYELAPAYDMCPMGFAPSSSGALSDSLPPPHIQSEIGAAIWRQALRLAQTYGKKLQQHQKDFSQRFAICIHALAQHLQTAEQAIGKLQEEE